MSLPPRIISPKLLNILELFKFNDSANQYHWIWEMIQSGQSPLEIAKNFCARKNFLSAKGSVEGSDFLNELNIKSNDPCVLFYAFICYKSGIQINPNYVPYLLNNTYHICGANLYDKHRNLVRIYLSSHHIIKELDGNDFYTWLKSSERKINLVLG